VYGDGKTDRFEATEPSYHLQPVQTGEVKWAIQARSSNELSPYSSFGHFQIQDYSIVKWIKPNVSEMSLLDKPKVDLEWTAISGVVEWTLEYSHVESKHSYSSKYKENKTKLELAKGGDWRFQVSGFDVQGILLAKSEPYPLRLTEADLLPAPILLGVSNFSLTGQADGSVEVRWNAVVGAKSYLLVLKDSSGTERTFETRKTEQSFKDLALGKYSLSLRTLNRQSKPGPASPQYKILIPTEREAAPPQIKRIIIH
jgi:hypothetical protein